LPGKGTGTLPIDKRIVWNKGNSTVAALSDSRNAKFPTGVSRSFSVLDRLFIQSFTNRSPCVMNRVCFGCALASTFLSLLTGSVSAREVQPGDEQLRLNEIQVIRTHNSYHLAPSPRSWN